MKKFVGILAVASVFGSTPAFSNVDYREACQAPAVKNAITMLELRRDFTKRSQQDHIETDKDLGSAERHARDIFMTSSILLDVGALAGGVGGIFGVAELTGGLLFAGGATVAGGGSILQDQPIKKFDDQNEKEKYSFTSDVKSPSTVLDDERAVHDEAHLTFPEAVMHDLAAFRELRAKIAEQANAEQSQIKSHWYDLGYGDYKYAHSLHLEDLKESSVNELESDYVRKVLAAFDRACS